MKYLKMNYMYRDGANYKSAGSVSFVIPSGPCPDDILLNDFDNRIRNAGGDEFIASEVNIPELFEWCGDPEIDHCYHEYINSEIVNGSKFVDILDERTPEEFLCIFENAPKKEFEPGSDRYKTSRSYFNLGKEKCKEAGVNDVVVVKEIDLHDFGSRSLWIAAKNSCFRPIFVYGRVDRVNIHVNDMLRKEDEEAFVSAVLKYDKKLEQSARSVAATIRKYGELGIDFVEATC